MSLISLQHPSSWYLGKGHASNDMGDGPDKTRPPKRPHPTPAPAPSLSQRDRGSSYDNPTMIPGKRSHALTKTPPRQQSLSRYLKAPRLDKIQPELARWAKNQSLTITPSSDGQHTVFYGSQVAIALHNDNLPRAIQCAISISALHQDQPEDIAALFGSIPLHLAIRVQDQHYRTIPTTGYCTPILLTSLLTGETHPMLNIPSQRAITIDSLRYLQLKSEESRMPEIGAALQVYIDHLADAATGESLAADYWMPADLMAATLEFTESQATLWEDDQALSPFTAGWMQPTKSVPTCPSLHRVTNIEASTILQQYSPTYPHVGHARDHHFRIEYRADSLNLAIKASLLNLVAQLRTNGTVPRPIALPLPSAAPFQAEHKGLLLFIAPHLLTTVQQWTRTIPTHRLNQTVSKLLHEMALITSAVEAPLQTDQERFHGVTEGRVQWSPLPSSLPLNWVALVQRSNTNATDTTAWSATALRDKMETTHVAFHNNCTLSLPAPLIDFPVTLAALIHNTCTTILRTRQHTRVSPPPGNKNVPDHRPMRLRFCPDATLVRYSPLPPPLVHPALKRYVPPPLMELPQRTRPARLTRKAALPVTSSPLNHEIATDAELYTLTSYGDKPDSILMGAATHPGSYYGAYARHRITANHQGNYPILGEYTDQRRGKQPRITHPTDLNVSDLSYAMECPSSSGPVYRDPFYMDTCTARAIDEAEVEEDENCAFELRNRKIWVVATQDIEPGEQLFTRYGYKYWMRSKWPHSLLCTMLQKYSPTISEEDRQHWRALITAKEDDARTRRLWIPRSILRTPTPSSPELPLQTRPTRATSQDSTPTGKRQRLTQRLLSPLPALPKHVYSSMHLTKRRQAKRQHKRDVQAGLKKALRPTPGPNTHAPYIPDFKQEQWTVTMDTSNTTAAQLCIMAWACQGELFPDSNKSSTAIPRFLRHAVELMKAQAVDILWLNDARFTKGSIDRYISLIHTLLPDCRVIQFPTTNVKTGSRCEEFNQMGGAVAIVNYTWKHYVEKTSTDPMGMGIINSIDIKVGPSSTDKIRSINVYLIPTQATVGKATIHSRVTRHQHQATSPPWIKRLSSIDFLFHLTQLLISSARAKGYVTVIHGDYNRPITKKTHPTPLDSWTTRNELYVPGFPHLYNQKGYHTYNSGGTTQNKTKIDHIMHSKLPEHLTIRQVGACNDQETQHHSDHRPIWIRLTVDKDVTIPPARKPLPKLIRTEIDPNNEDLVPIFSEKVHRALMKQIPKRFKKLNKDKSTAISPDDSGRLVGAAMRITAQVAEEVTDAKKKNKQMQRTSKKRSSCKNGFSVNFLILKAYLTFYHNLIRLAFPSGRRKNKSRWTSISYQSHLTRLINEWTKHYRSILAQMLPSSPAHYMKAPAHLQYMDFYQITKAYIAVQLKMLKSEMHGADRSEMRLTQNSTIRYHDQLRAQGKLAMLIRLLTGDPDYELDLQTLPVGQIVEHYEIQRRINQYFEDWHAIPKTLDPAARHLAVDPLWWLTLLHCEPTDSNGSQLTEEPQASPSLPDENTLPQYYSPMKNPDQPTKSLSQEETDTAMNALLVAEVPGSTQVMADTLKRWSRTTWTYLYQQLLSQWPDQDPFEWFQGKWTMLAPKINRSRDLHAISTRELYGILQTIWTTAIAKRECTAASLQPTLNCLHPRSSIPRQMQKGLRKVCAKKVTPHVERQVAEAINSKITLVDFEDAIEAIPADGAPGPSQVTANMIKAWSAETRAFIYQHMLNMWSTRTTPRWFKDKLLKLAPKIAGNSDLSNMRPISLYEIIRKVWTTIVAKRINLVWHTNKVLHPAQYGYQLDNGVHMALFNTINQIEGARMDKETKHITFWDIRRAFDSIPRTLQKLAWMRLGVPRDVTEWFVELDDHGLTFIYTPYYAHNSQLHNPEDMLREDNHMSANPGIAYEAQRGIGQGESASSLMWTAMYDILLEWIDPKNMQLHSDEVDLAYTMEDAVATKLNAYADDLGTLTAGPKRVYMQQVLANWISAFCTFTGLVMNPTKIKATVVGPIPHHPLLPLRIHQHDGTEVEIKVDSELQTFKYLGVYLDLRDNPQATLQAVIQDADKRLSHLIQQAGSPSTKIDYIRFKIMPIVLYTALCSNWSLAQYRLLDKPFTYHYKKILCLPATSPGEMLYLPSSMAGVGLPRPSDRAQKLKWEALLRCNAVGREPKQSVHDFLDRIPSPPHPSDTPLRLLTCPDTWQCESCTHLKRDEHMPPAKLCAHYHITARSLIEWADESGLQLAMRTFLTEQDKEERTRTSDSIEELAKQLCLWPDPEMYGDEQELMNVRLFATDGSFSANPDSAEDIIAPEADLRDRGKGSGGIVFIPEDKNAEPQGVHISSDNPEPGMNAFTWELVTQLVALHMVKHLPPTISGYSDCTSAIARTTVATRTTYDTLAHTSAGLWASGIHQFASGTPRQFIHVKAHPERDPERSANPTILDRAIFMADAVAASARSNLRTDKKLGKLSLPVNKYHLKLENIMNEIIPVNQWHFRLKDTHSTPVLNDLMHHQHKATLLKIVSKRDQHNREQRWTSTALSFASTVHPPTDGSFWATARRALLLFDWLGHGRNRAKTKPPGSAQQAAASLCIHCKQLDSQAHCMLACPMAKLTPLRKTARIQQSKVAAKLLSETECPNATYFIQMLFHASWIDSPQTTRLWLGTWQLHTLQALLGHAADEKPTAKQRYAYIRIAKLMTEPLIAAYNKMININMHHRPAREDTYQDVMPLYDNIPSSTYTPIHPPPMLITHNIPLSPAQATEIEALFSQTSTITAMPSVYNAQHTIHDQLYDISDASFLVRGDEDGTF